MFKVFSERRKAIEADGVYIGGFKLRNSMIPEKKADGSYNTTEDRIEQFNAAEQDWTPQEEAKLLRKLDLRVLLPCCIIYFVAYLDRVNLGNVKVLRSNTPDSIKSSLHLEGTQFNWAVSISYFSVTALLIPSTILFKKFSAKRYFPIIMVLWGTVVMAIAGVRSGPGLLAARFFLGVPESGVVPCCVLYFSFWYRPRERAWRLAVFHAFNALAGAVSAFFATAIDHLNGKGGLKSWQWVFIIEGALPIALAVPVYFLLLTFPEDSKALSERERYIAINRFGRGATRSTDVTWDTSAFIRIMTRPSTYCFFISYICVTIIAVSQATFLPTIFHELMNFSSTKSNLYTAVVYLAIIPLYLIWSLHSDWVRERMWHFILPCLGSIPCYAVWTYFSFNADATTIQPISLYGVAFMGKAIVISQPIILSFRSSTLYGAAEQAVGTSAAVASLSIASIVAPQIFPDSDGPLYQNGFVACLVLEVVAILSYCCIPVLLLLEAERRKKKTGHVMPLRAILDAENAQVSDATLARMHAIQEKEAAENLQNAKLKGDSSGAHVEHVEMGRK
ncbi:hypothetical protein N7457_006181 [Penicillium paradoxum]|uniref:uncharacterized protein n=1 Tax=Penicillium paradoxum TaxID=176176 RepID=UPI0025499F06|nr:uncharacterized protein N7457_006181 [Penicillium paradoxum]KAJ5781021.1 hypothetical protein N7457_006181 [Penicillium paradoxum]